MHRPRDKKGLKLFNSRRMETCRRHRIKWSGRSSESKPATFKARVEIVSQKPNRATTDSQEVI